VAPLEGGRSYRLRHAQYGGPEDAGLTFNIQVLIIRSVLVDNGTIGNNVPILTKKYIEIRNTLNDNNKSAIVNVIRQ
jgi:hypothetical protein